ncbi:unnamed protein product, partial [Lymnaea stagnalis]
MSDSETSCVPYQLLVDDDSSTDLVTPCEPISTGLIQDKTEQPISINVTKSKISPPIRKKNIGTVKLDKPIKVGRNRNRHIQPIRTVQTKTEVCLPIRTDQTKNKIGQPIGTAQPGKELGQPIMTDQTKNDLCQSIKTEQTSKLRPLFRKDLTENELVQPIRKDLTKIDFFQQVRRDQTKRKLGQYIRADQRKQELRQKIGQDPPKIKLCQPIREDQRKNELGQPDINELIKCKTDQPISTEPKIKNLCPPSKPDLTPLKLRPPTGYHLSTKSSPPIKRNSTSSPEDVKRKRECSIIKPEIKAQNSPDKELSNIPATRPESIHLKVSTQSPELDVRNDSGNANFEHCFVPDGLNNAYCYGEQIHLKPCHQDEWIKTAELSPDFDLWVEQIIRDHDDDHTDQPSLTVIETERMVDSLFFDNTSSKATVPEDPSGADCCFMSEMDLGDFARVRSLNLESIKAEQWRRYAGERVCRESSPLCAVQPSRTCVCSHGNGCFWQRPQPPVEASIYVPELIYPNCVYGSGNAEFFYRPIADTVCRHASLHNPFLNECPGYKPYEPDFAVSDFGQFVASDAMMSLAKARFLDTLASLSINSADQVVMLKPEDIRYFDDHIKPFPSSRKSESATGVRPRAPERKSAPSAGLLDRGDVAEDVA